MKIFILATVLIIVCLNASAYVSQGNWRWRNDNGTESSATWKGPQNISIALTNANNLRLRIQVYNTLADDKHLSFPLQYATSLDGPWKYISRAENSNAFVLTRKSSYVADNILTTQQIGGSSYVFQSGKLLTNTDLPDTLLPAQKTSEYEWCIKPTQYILATTTYYFRTPVGDYPVVLPSLTTGSSSLIKKPLLSNGSFEQDLNGWTNLVSDGGDAAFAVVDSVHHYGEKSLRLSVEKLGSATGSLQTSHTSFTTSPAHTYLVRFWGKAKKGGSKLRLVLQGNTAIEISFQLFPDMEEYQYAFKTSETSLTLKFYYNTVTDYVLDDIEVLVDTDPTIDVNMDYMWQNNRAGYGWVSGDGQESIKLPDGRIAWFFSDSWLGYNDTTTNSVSTSLLINNMAVLQGGTAPSGTLTSKFGGTVSAAKALVLPPVSAGYQNWLWPRGMIVENNQLKLLLSEFWYKTNGADATYRNKEVLATFSLPAFILQSAEYLPFIDSLEFNVILDDTSNYTYVYGAKEVSTFTYETKVARYPKGQLSTTVPWEFYSYNGWVTDYHKAKTISDAPFSSVLQLGPNNYAAVFLGPLSDKIEAYYAPSPIGPWANRTILYQVPGENHLTYYAIAHKETNKNGVYTISYSNNYTIGRMLHDKGIYTPNYQKVNLLILSPYTTSTPDVNFSAIPVNMQVFPRNIKTNQGSAKIEGSVINGDGYKSIAVLQYRENVLQKKYKKDLVYTGDSASFKFDIPIKAELANHKLEIYGILQDNSTTLLRTVDSLLAGAAIIIQGQSNAVADEYYGSSNAENQSNFIRAWGSAGFHHSTQWFIGNGDVGDVGPNDGNTGQWGLRLAKRLVDSEHIPVVIFNGARGGKPVTYFEKAYSNGINNYNNLLHRIQESGFINEIRAICWFQGESDSNVGVTVNFYKDSFNLLYSDWKKDYDGFKKLYIIQTKQSCNADAEASAIISEAHRQLALEIPNASILSTHGVKHFSKGLWCHYSYDSGYKVIGDYMFLMVNRDVRNLVNAKNIESPQVTQIIQTAANQLTLYFKNAADTYSWEAGTENDFVINNTTAKISSGVVQGATVVLTMDKRLLVDSISFYGHMVGGAPCIRNAAGEGIVGFYKFPVTHTIASKTSNNLSASATNRMSIFPNPAKEKVTVNYTIVNASAVSISIADITGKILLRVNAGELATGLHQTTVNTNSLSAGIYLLKLQTGCSVSSVKFVKE